MINQWKDGTINDGQQAETQLAYQDIVLLVGKLTIKNEELSKMLWARYNEAITLRDSIASNEAKETAAQLKLAEVEKSLGLLEDHNRNLDAALVNERIKNGDLKKALAEKEELIVGLTKRKKAKPKAKKAKPKAKKAK